jgi:glutamate-1-semialdehyde 2,1-aminomutase
MAYPIYNHDKSHELFAHAQKVIPSGIYGHQGPSEGCWIPVGDWPAYSDHAKGSYFWDVDGNKYIDYMCAYGPNVLGYNDEEVDEAALRQAAKENCVTAPGSVMVDFADLLVDTVDCADWAFFCKNGSDATTGAIMCARSHTKREKIVFFKGYYHGVHPWCEKVDYPGIIPGDVAGSLYVPWNDFDALQQCFEENKGEIAALIAHPYMHGNFFDNILPADGFWPKVRKLCDDYGVVLVIDDVRSGWRIDLRGSDHYWGFKADLICFCKALANGWNVSAICGQEKFKSAMSSLSFTGSYWMSAVPFAAGIACINKMKRIDLPKLLDEKGQKLKAGLIETAKKHGYDLHVTGIPALFYLRIADDDLDGTPTLLLHQRWVNECVKRGLYFTSHHNHFLNASLTDDDIKTTLEIADEAFAAI